MSWPWSPVECSTMGQKASLSQACLRRRGRERVGVGGEGRDLCYAGPFNDVTLLIILALKGNKEFRFERGVGWGGGETPTKEH